MPQFPGLRPERRRAIAHRVGLAHRASLNDETTARASAESEVILSEDRRQVLSALARLPRRRREVLVLRYYLGLSEAEIAAVLGISAGTWAGWVRPPPPSACC